jgi:hypothetical protein
VRHATEAPSSNSETFGSVKFLSQLRESLKVAKKQQAKTEVPDTSSSVAASGYTPISPQFELISTATE